ncbi:flagellar motor protein MotB [Clostridium magnum]|uniref:Motility protein B n=1 Tax=Clostridium magnum DSM 2767 TaxID=1121326 RepID=A0A161YI39_9CLOT|nr:flagellar motor protein MotB [Clostridium magnum]KZL89982.1 motility protein B [Clostridium magnum DSM 2767]SHI86159.1 chemotaxis protein MotB [Clostridium magnum DSM 2767]
MKKKKPEGHMNHERWLLSYSDFMTLLMILFVVLFAMSSVDQTKYKQLSESMKIAMGGGKSIVANQDAVSITENSKPLNTEIQAENEQSKLEKLQSQVDKYLEQNGMKGSVSTQIDERGLVVSINDTLFFDSGRAEIKTEPQKKLIEIGKIVNQLDNYIRVEGHTDNVPISNGQFSSNWQLSSARAANVTQFLITNSGIQPQKLSAVGYGEYRPILDNSTEEGRAKNRRVDIIIVNSKFNKIENNKIGENLVTKEKK